jgi:hypothetical protein
MFAELETKGFIKARQRGSFGWKARHSTTWILTLHEYLGREPTKTFMQWTQPEIQKPVSPGDTDGITGRYRGRPKTPLTVSPGDTVKAESEGRSVSPGDTVLVYQGVGSSENVLKREPRGQAAISPKSTYAGKPTLKSRTLELLRANGACRPRDIIQEFGCYPGEAGRALKALCDHGLAERTGHGLYRAVGRA